MNFNGGYSEILMQYENPFLKNKKDILTSTTYSYIIISKIPSHYFKYNFLFYHLESKRKKRKIG